MLTAFLAHAGDPEAAHLWRSWNLEPGLLLGILATLAAYVRGRGAGSRRPRTRWFAAGMAAVAVALLSPLDALAGQLASAHMVQHLLLVLVAAPLLASAAPTAALVRGAPAVVRRTAARWRRPVRTLAEPVRTPGAVFVAHAGTLWFWHAAAPYEAALHDDVLHAAEHITFLATAVLFWHLAVGAYRAGRPPHASAILLVFAVAMQMVLLSALLTFAGTPWYPSYASTTARWGLHPLADQQLAGVLMWVPSAPVYLGTALALLVAWLRSADRSVA